MPKNTDKFDDFAKEVWGKRAEGLPVSGFDITRPPSHADVLYMLQRYAYVQLVDPNGETSDEIKFIRTDTNWLVLDYGNAMSTSPGQTLFGNAVFQKDDDGTYRRLNTGTGTRVKQIVDTATEMVSLADKKDWKNIHIVAGQDLMKWAVWASAQEFGIEVSGYHPSKEEIAKLDRIRGEFKTIIQPAPNKFKPE